MITSFQEIIEKKFEKGGKSKRVAVVCAESDHTVEAAIRGYEEGLIEPVLIGRREVIEEMLAGLGCKHTFDIADARTMDECVVKMQEMVHAGECDAVMKGLIDTKVLMKAIVTDKEAFRTDNIISSICYFKIPNYPKLLAVTDSGVVTYPNLEQKKGLIKNTVECFHKLGYEKPKVAILCSVDKVNPKMPETLDAQELTRLGEAGELGDCVVYGPLSYDLIVDKESVEIKGSPSDVAGDADIIIVPDINTGNCLVKALCYSAQADSASIIAGTKIPVIISSRSSSAEEKYWSLIFSCALE